MQSQPTAELGIVRQAQQHAAATAIVSEGREYTYAALLDASARVAAGLLAGRSDLAGERVCFLLAPGFDYVAVLWGIFRAGGAAVPLCVQHPAPELSHVLDDAKPLQLIADREFEPRLRELAASRGLTIASPTMLRAHPAGSLPALGPERNALLIYTSGTTGRPKAAITTHGIFEAQLRSIVSAWELRVTDRILHALPLHHLHGVLNALSAPLYAGACVEMLPQFHAQAVLTRCVTQPQLSVFMGVPTMYAKLEQAASALTDAERRVLRERFAAFRLLISGSAALPVTLLTRFEAISGHVLLERYGMTELGMALGNPLHGERRAGTVGVPFPGVEARIVDEHGQALEEGEAGELQIRGPNVFAGYFGRPEATAASFTPDGFFRTGDVAVRERGYYRLLGRASVDIIKTGGFKVSALEIEETLREHPAIAEVAVVGLPDAEWGERVAAAVVLSAGHALSLEQLREFGKERIAAYKVPSRLFCLAALPRNVMGKVEKPALTVQLRALA